MTAHIPPHLLLPQDMVDVIDHGPPEQLLRMHASDARHALSVEPDRYELHDPKPKAKLKLVEPEPETEEGTDG